VWICVRLVNCKKWCTRLAAASDKVYQLLAHGRWFSPGSLASSTNKTDHQDITEILLKVAWNTITITQILFFDHCKVNSIYKFIPQAPVYKMVRVLLCLWRLLQKHVVPTKLYIYVFIQVHCVWYFIHVLISQSFYSGTLCLVLYTCTYISMLLFRYVVFGTLYMYLYLNVFIQVHCVWYFIHVLISQCFYSGTLCLVLYTCTYISMFLLRYIVFGNLYMYLYFNVFICLNRNTLFPHFIYCIFIPKIVKMGSTLLVCHYNLSML
jgi:hypothetical protein